MPMTQDTNNEDFISMYLRYTSQTESPTFFHRWCAISCLAAFLGRSTYYKFGHSTLYPNLYTILIGVPGTKKSSAIKIGAKLLKAAGYNKFAAKKTRQEKFLLDLAEQSERASGDFVAGGTDESSILDMNLFGDDLQGESSSAYEDKVPAECLIAADEFNNFIGLNNLDFISILGELWDYEGVYDYKLKNSKSIFIPNPTVSILGGNTATGMAQAFPPEVIGQGFFSRLFLVYAEPTGVKITFPPPPDLELQAQLISKLHKIKATIHGEMELSSKATELVDRIYRTWKGVDDLRFEHYANRRLPHLLKLCLTMAASRESNMIHEQDVIYANTVLSFTEQLMPKALGEFGKARNSASTHKVMSIIYDTVLPVSVQGIWKLTVQDFDNRNQLIEVLSNLTVAKKIQSVDGGYLPVKKVMEDGCKGAVNWNLLTQQELGLR